MSSLAGSGITVDVPSGWEGRIYSKPEPAGFETELQLVPFQ